MRIIIDRDPYLGRPENANGWTRGLWPAAWIGHPETPTPPSVVAYRQRMMLASAVALRIHVSADERYELFLDGTRIGRGSERGDPHNWFFETYDLALAAGPHVMVALVWSLGSAAPVAQMSVYPGLLVAPQEDKYLPLLATGVAEWEATILSGYHFVDVAATRAYYAVGANVVIDGHAFAWGFERGTGTGWQPARVLDPGVNGETRAEYPPLHLLKPVTLPPMLDQLSPPGNVRIVTAPADGDVALIPLRRDDHLPSEQAAWRAWLHDGQPLTLPPETYRRVVIDLERYVCAYPELVVSGGNDSSIRVHWAEALFCEPEATTKGNRNAVDDHYFLGLGDTFLPDGGTERSFRPLWWRCGRYLELVVTTAAEALTLDRLLVHETRYPLEMESTFASSDPRLEQSVPIMVRALQMCAHETYMDCPYYEQLMYAGDTRLEVLVTYVMTRDDRLPRKALRMFDVSRLPSGLTQSRYPSRITQIIPPFALWWVAMVYDYALWRDDLSFVRSLMPGVRAVLDRFYSLMNSDGLVEAPPGWNFMDWVPEWVRGVPPDGELGVSGVINWQLALVLTQVARLEGWLGEDELATRTSKRAATLAAQLSDRFWDGERGLFADDLQRQHFSEHSQCLALLSGVLDAPHAQRVAAGLLRATDLARTTIYFSHYLLEAYTALGHIDALVDRLQLWFDLPGQGFTTTPEAPEPSRSDCHAWGSHPLYHYFASIIGIRPTTPGFRHVEVRPQLGRLTAVHGTLPHPRGQVEVELRVEHTTLTGEITLPNGVAGNMISGGQTVSLTSGRNIVALSS
ncbi:MAG: alpha-L-rhamnosidase [Herpetosiphonaceae bacterium]|nr:alpha-L-rhamnosidase [Herpetosiphonaceae bacterium]